ncbi:hypothetical protein B6V76_15520 [Thioclava sp. IC9]|nr:hypothetical protein B6V76_15520 [Thioclava sp. IC9]
MKNWVIDASFEVRLRITRRGGKLFFWAGTILIRLTVLTILNLTGKGIAGNLQPLTLGDLGIRDVHEK